MSGANVGGDAAKEYMLYSRKYSRLTREDTDVSTSYGIVSKVSAKRCMGACLPKISTEDPICAFGQSVMSIMQRSIQILPMVGQGIPSTTNEA